MTIYAIEWDSIPRTHAVAENHDGLQFFSKPSRTMTATLLRLRNVNDNGGLPKWNRKSLDSGNSGNLINHRSMNWAQFKDPVSHMCLDDAVVASKSLT